MYIEYAWRTFVLLISKQHVQHQLHNTGVMPGITKQSRDDVKYKVVCVLHMITVSFYRRDLSIYSLWYLKGSWNQSLLDPRTLALIELIYINSNNSERGRYTGVQCCQMVWRLSWWQSSSGSSISHLPLKKSHGQMWICTHPACPVSCTGWL